MIDDSIQGDGWDMGRQGFLSTGLAVGLGLFAVVGLSVVILIEIMVTVVKLFMTLTTLTAL